MADRPLLLNGEMVRAVLAGTKTQTRRPVKVPWAHGTRCPPYGPYYVEEDGRLLFCDEYGDYHPMEIVRGAPAYAGGRLWVRETWCEDDALGFPCIVYAADNAARVSAMRDGVPFAFDNVPPLTDHPAPGRWRPSIHMPRWASRITLAVESVRVERLQAITEEDARAEGVERMRRPDRPINESGTHRDGFAMLWDHIYFGDASWAANPWTWRIAFRLAADPERTEGWAWRESP